MTITALQLLSFLIGALLISIYLGHLVSKLLFDENTKPTKYLVIFLSWGLIHTALSIKNQSKEELVNRIYKSDKTYYLDQNKSGDLILDKETYDKLLKLGNGNQLYISQDFWVSTSGDNKEEKYSINEYMYNVILKKISRKEEVCLNIKYDAWGNKTIEVK